MKSLTPILFNSVLLLNATIILAQEPIRGQGTEYKAQENKEGVMNGGEYNCLDNQFPTSNLLSSSSYLGVTPKLMMNPSSIEKGTKAVGEALGIFGKDEIVNTISSSSSHQVLRLRGGGLKKNQPTGGLKSTGETSDEEDNVGDPDVESEDTQPMSGQVNKYLKNEIINNIYTECLVEVAKLTLGGNVNAGNVSKETAEWAAAKEAAEYSKRKAERAVTIAAKKTEEVKSMMDEAKKNAKAAARVPVQGSAAEQAVIAATVNYEKAREVYIIADYKAKKLEEELVEARVETADANLYAISVRNTAQKTTAETGLDTAKETEMEVLEAVEAAKADVAVKADLLSSAEASLNDAKKVLNGTSPTSPMTAAQKVAMKEVEEDKALAEAAKSAAKKTELKANVAKGKIHEMNFERELKAYHDAEEAWMEAGEGYKTALAKVHEVGLDDEELTAALASAEVHEATWRAHARWTKARQVDQMAAAPGASLDHLTAAEEAWASAVEGYKIAVEKAMQANLTCLELTTALNNAVDVQEQITVQVQAQLIDFATIKATQARDQATAAQASKAALKKRVYLSSYVDAWEGVAFKSEQASESWDKMREALTRGKQEVASLWRKAAEKESTTAEGWEQIALVYAEEDAEEDEEKARRLDKTSWITYHLSNAARWLAESKEALEKGHQDIAEFWRRASMEAQEAAEYWNQAVQVYALGNTEDGEHWENVAKALGGHYSWTGGSAVCLSKVAEYLTKVTEESDKGNPEVVTLWTKGAKQMKESAKYYRKVAEAKLSGNNSEADRWEKIANAANYSANRLELAAKAIDKATIATAKGNQSLVESWSKTATQNKTASEYWNKATETNFSKNGTEINCWEKIASSAGSCADQLESAAGALEKATIAIAKGNKLLAELWSNSCAQHQEGVEYYCKVTEAKLSKNNEEEDRLGKIADSVVRSIWRLKLADEALEKAIEATKKNQSLADLWSKTAMQYQKTVKYYREAAKAALSGKNKEVNHWEKIASSYESSAWKFDLAAEAFEKGMITTVSRNKFLTELWNKTVTQYQETAEHYRKAAEARLNGNDVEADGLEQIAFFSASSALRLSSAAKALKKANKMTAEANKPLAELWSKISVQNQKSAEHYQKVTEAKLSGNNAEADFLEKIASSVESSAVRLCSAVEALKKASEATVIGNKLLIELWNKIVTQNEKLAEYYRKVAEAKLNGNDAEADRWDKIANSASRSVYQLELAAEAIEKATTVAAKGDESLVDLWNKKATHYQEIADLYWKESEGALHR